MDLELILDKRLKCNDNLTMIILGAIWMGFLLGMGAQSVHLKKHCEQGKEYACKADKDLHSFKHQD